MDAGSTSAVELVFTATSLRSVNADTFVRYDFPPYSPKRTVNPDALKHALRPWMQVSTWYTFQPADDERFHYALRRAFDQLGASISGEDFRKTMTELAKELHPDWEFIHLEAIVGRFAVRAKHISAYVRDTAP